MRALRIPHDVWGWRSTAVVLLLVATPTIAILQLVPDGRTLTTAAATRAIVIAIGLLTGATALYLHARVTASDESGWLSVALWVGAVPALALGAFGFAHPGVVHRQWAWFLVFRLASTGLMLILILMARRCRLRVDALALGVLVGLLLAVGRQLTIGRAAPLGPAEDLELWIVVALCLLTVAFAWALMRLEGLPAWLRVRCSLAMGLLALAIAIDPTATRHTWLAAVSLTTALLAAVLMASTTAAFLHEALVEERTLVADLQAELERMEVGVREDRARLHEIDSTVAGIASASRLIRNNPGLTEGRRAVLTGMMAAEAERLHRILAARSAEGPRPVDLDDIVGRIVLAHRARGHRVGWAPSGVLALGRADDVAEVVDVLLQNAADHGSPDRIEVTVTERSGLVELAVLDHGPGVASTVRGRIFDWGVRGPGSPGTGIGLHVARDLARTLGGDLLVDESRRSGTGARFLLRLPAVPSVREGVSGAGAALPAT